VAGFFSFANPSRFFFLSQNLQIFGLALRKKAQYVVVTIESYGDHYPGLHLKLAMMCHVIKFSKSLALFFIVALNMNFYTSR
jgi:hypothetical protein